jgi:hypothetical protein
VSDDASFPRDDRSWPRGAFTFSLSCGVAALAGSAAILVSADSPRTMAGLGVAFLLAAGLEAAAYVAGIRPWLAGQAVPRQVEVAQVVLVLLGFLMFAAGPAFGGVVLCGLLAGAFLTNAGAIRYARFNREMAEQGELRLAEARLGGPREGPHSAQLAGQQRMPGDDPEGDLESNVGNDMEPSSEWVPRGPVPHVGRALRASLVEERGRWLAWAAASVVAILGCVAAGETETVVYGVGFVAAGALFWAGSRFLGGWQALRDYEQAKTEPRRAYVALLNDPNARVTRPLLGVWSQEPLPQQGRLPRAEAVYRCDEERSALMSPPGRVIVHEAWVDTGPRSGSRPRWVVADAGLALPHQTAVLGGWYLASLIGSERPAGARPLTVRAPHPDNEPTPVAAGTLITERTPVLGSWARQFAWRLATLLGVALMFTWLD